MSALWGLAGAATLSPEPAEAAFGFSSRLSASVPGMPRGFTAADYAALDPGKQEKVASLLLKRQLQQFFDELKAQKAKAEAELEAFSQEDQAMKASLGAAVETLNQAQQEVRDAETALKEKAAELVKAQKELEGREASREEAAQAVRDAEAALASNTTLESKVRLKTANDELIGLSDGARLMARDVTLLDGARASLQQRLDVKMKARDAVELEVAALTEKSKELTSDRAGAEEIDKRIARYKASQESIAAREAKLAALDAQPDWFNYVAAFTASCLSTLVMHPVDTLKTRRIARRPDRGGQPGGSGGASPGGGTAAVAADAEFFSLEGVLSLYQGLSGNILKEGPATAVYIGVYEAVKTRLLASPEFAMYPIFVYLIAGALGETVGSFIRCPAEAIKSRLQSGTDAGIGDTVERVFLTEQGRGLLVRAWSSSVWRDVPHGSIQLAVFEGLKNYIATSPDSILNVDVNTLAGEVLLASIGGGLGALLTTPPDVVTTRILTQANSTCDDPAGFAGMTKKMLQEGGWRALCTGWTERTAYWAPALGLFVYCYCAVRQAAIAQNLFPVLPTQ